ncbi:MarR family transcriptional regulator [Microbacterium gorillae]|uniref:MarR family transcriptional regulator n=1 Tax=Microbacterium gorillae TaxID=1231063 RepID=UPI0011426C4B|nr:MarR family transcriptional regulator [Microbacterium gorillae]
MKGRASDEAYAHMLGISDAQAADRRAVLTGAGLARHREGRIAFTSLTPEGRELHATLLAERLDDAERRRGVEDALAAFLPINGEMKRVFASWQTRPDGSPNAHDDQGYDGSVVEEAATVNARATALLRSSSTVEPRLARYADRLDAALRRVQSGESGAFLRPMSESYHDIWMELHEDLILLAGRERNEHDEG